MESAPAQDASKTNPSKIGRCFPNLQMAVFSVKFTLQWSPGCPGKDRPRVPMSLSHRRQSDLRVTIQVFARTASRRFVGRGSMNERDCQLAPYGWNQVPTHQPQRVVSIGLGAAATQLSLSRCITADNLRATLKP